MIRLCSRRSILGRTLLACGLLVLWAGVATAAAKAPVRNHDEFPFCTVESPSFVMAGDELEFLVKLANIPEGARIEAALCKSNPSGFFDSILQESPAQAARAHETISFKYKIDAATDASRVSLIVRLKNPGKEAKTDYAPCSNVSIRRARGSKPAAAAAATGEAALKTVQIADWCKATMPGVLEGGKPFEVKLELQGVKAPNTISCHLHKMNADGSFGGMLGWAPPKNTAGETTFTFRYNVAVQEGRFKGHITVFLSPNGDWTAKTAAALGPDLPFVCHLPVRPPAANFKSSWLCIEACNDRTFTEGDRWPVSIDFYLAPSDDWGGTAVKFQALGPWIDNPDGTYTKTRGHQPPNLTQFAPVRPGRGTVYLPLVIPKASPRNSFLCIGAFQGADKLIWPWEVRMNGPWFRGIETQFRLKSAKPGNLFTYDEPVEMLVENYDSAAAGACKRVDYKLFDTEGTEVAKGTTTLTVPALGAIAPLAINTTRRGVMVLEVEIEGWGKHSTTLARIPDVLAVSRGAEGQFGMTDDSLSRSPERAEEQFQIAKKLGFGVCRLMMQWRNFNPARGDWRLERVDQFIDTANRNGIRPWICLSAPPAWIQKADAPSYVSFAPFDFDVEGWRETADFLARRYKGKILGFEWLNEIVPGNKTEHPVEDYLRFCQIGTAAVKAVDPSFFIQLAGGLWPRNFRNDLLKAGVGSTIDCLPIHYSDGQAVLDAKADVAAAGCGNVRIWDNETGRGISTWNVPAVEAVRPDIQGNWILTNWSDELVAGIDKIVFFGGWPDAAGNWSYMMDDMTPRPVAATLAVFTSKLFDARPVGKFFLPGEGVFHLFEKNGRAILLASSTAKEPQTVKLPVGAAKVTVTDWQGNETELATAAGVADLKLAERRVFVEGANLDVLKSQLAVEVVDAAGSQSMPHPFSSVTILRSDASPRVPIVVKNIFAEAVTAQARVRVADGWGKPPVVSLVLQPGESKELAVPLAALQGGILEGVYDAAVQIAFAASVKLPLVEKAVSLNVISPSMLGNLLVNGNFEKPKAEADKTVPGWDYWGAKATQADAQGLGLGLGRYVAKFADVGNNWASIAQNVPSARGGKVYLYSAWIWNTGIRAGSNVTLEKKDGTKKTLTIPSVFDAGENSAAWKLYTCHIDAGADVDHLAVVPTVNGRGQAYVDNVRLTVYEGTDFAAECHRVVQPPKIDGRLDDWQRSCPVPLLAENQLLAFDKSYQWTPERLSGVAYFSWDAKNLYVGIEVLGGSGIAQTDEKTLEGDSIVLAIHPANRKPGADDKAFQYWISKAPPGGGSGKCTLYRPASHCGGLASGHLARDSSVYEIAISTEGKLTTYEIRIPLGDLGLSAASLGTKIGLSLQLNDGRRAQMSWGGGLYPAWSPRHMGVLTFVE
jgi:predicted RecA/RadA family phage recombinase